MSMLLDPRGVQSMPMGGFPNAGQPSIMDAPQVPQQQMQQANFGQRFKQNMGPILQALGYGIASGNLGRGAAMLPELSDRRQSQMMQQQEMAQEQQRLNATYEWAKTQDPEVADMIAKGIIDPNTGFKLIQERRQAKQEGQKRQLINAGDGRLYDANTNEWIMAPGGGKPAEPASPLGKLKRDLDSGLITQEQYKALADRETAAPTQGGLTTSQKNELGKSEAAIQTLNSELDSYAEMVGQTGNAYMPGQTRDAVAAKRRNIQLQMKELYNLGVLNGPDLALMDQMLYDAAPNDVTSMVGGVATSVGGALGADGMNPANRARANADTLKAQFKKLLEDKRAALGVGDPATAGGGMPDVSTMTDEELEALANGR
jgi:hypothetical protein